MEAFFEHKKLIIKNEAEFYKKIINTANASIHIMKIDENGNTLPVWMNKRYSEILGYSFEDRQKIGFDYKKDELYHPDDIELIHQGIKDVFNDRENIPALMFRAKTAKGDWKWVLTSASIITFGKEEFLLSLIVDVSKNLEEYSILIERYSKEIISLKNQIKLSSLTEVEKEIIKELAKGKTTKHIAELRNRSFETINNHRRNIFKKLQIHKISELACFATESGLV